MAYGSSSWQVIKWCGGKNTTKMTMALRLKYKETVSLGIRILAGVLRADLPRAPFLCSECSFEFEYSLTNDPAFTWWERYTAFTPGYARIKFLYFSLWKWCWGIFSKEGTVEFEYNSFSVPKELLGLCNKNQLMAKPQKERKPDWYISCWECIEHIWSK